MRLSNLYEIFWPRGHEDDVLFVARKRLLVALAMTTGLLGTASALISFQDMINDFPLQTWVGLIGPALCVAAPFLLHSTGRLNTISAGVIALIYVLILVPALSLGGAANPVMLYMAGLPVLATFLIGYRAGIVTAAVTIVSIVSLFAFRDVLPTLPAGFDAAEAARWNTITLSFLIIAIAAFAAVFQAEMEAVNKRLDAARKAANAGNEAKSQFLATMSHEIRTPMNGVLGMTSLLQMSELTGPQRQQVEIIHESGEMLMRLLNEILDMSKIEAGMLELESIAFDLRDVVEQVTELHQPNAARKGLHLSAEIEDGLTLDFEGDPMRIGQVLNNLISNAVKFTAAGTVTLTVRDEDGRIAFDVSDTGVGIQADKLHKLFEPFTQADASTTRQYGGTGLGLSISRHLCDLMGGDLRAVSAPGQGSTFTAVLPLTRLSEAIDDQAADTRAA
ncbi:sensor histidine kinase [Hyphobacterium sp.]|uniref:sensor histidine kinase n=1 Tax=Hyphobacterium sp. TaxID=2004662 RepID=UPI003BAB27C0